MSRSGYTDDHEDQWSLIRWRGAVKSAIRGKRGQAALREILAALDAMPEKALAAESLVTEEGEFCTLGALGAARGIDMTALNASDPDDDDFRSMVAQTFGIAEALAAEIMYLNDEHTYDYKYIDVEICGPMRHYDSRTTRVRVVNEHAAAQRWHFMRSWVAGKIKTSAESAA